MSHTYVYTSFKNIVIAIGSSASPFTTACIYWPPGSYSDAFFDHFFHLFEYLSSVSSSFFMCGDFNIHVHTTSSDSVKFLNCLDSCKITHHVHTATHLHEHILDLILKPTEPNVVSNVRVGGFISDHGLVQGQLDFISPSAPKSNTVAFQVYHKINMQSLMCDANCSFVANPGNTARTLYKQYIGDLSGLFEKYAAEPLPNQGHRKQFLVGGKKYIAPTRHQYSQTGHPSCHWDSLGIFVAPILCDLQLLIITVN